ncbi:hypothetical protein EMIT0P4_140009 [Pseudomonas sp. IT-P4]
MPGFVFLAKIKRSQPSAAPTPILVGAAEGCDLGNFEYTEDLTEENPWTGNPTSPSPLSSRTTAAS